MDGRVETYPAAVERAMKVQEVILRALAKRISWWPAAEILGFRIGVCGAGAALPRARLWRTVRAATREAESQAGAAGAGSGSGAALPGEAWHRLELHLGDAGCKELGW